MNKKVMLLLLGAALTLSACGKDEEEPTKDTVASTSTAEDTYKKSCASCHGGDLSGGFGPPLAKVGSKYSKDEIEKIIKDGRGGMPKGIIQGEDVTKMAQWLADKK